MDVLNQAFPNLWFSDFNDSYPQDVSEFTTADFPLDFVNDIPFGNEGQFGNDPALGFGGDFVPLPYQGQQWPFGGWDDMQFGPELAPQLMGDKYHPHDSEWDWSEWDAGAVSKHPGHRADKRKRKPPDHQHRHHHHHHESPRRHRGGRRTAPRADGPGYFDSAHYNTNTRSATPDPPQQQPFDVPPPPPPPPPPISSSAQGSSSQQGVNPEVNLEADEVSSQSSHDSSVSSHSSSDATPIYRQPERLAKDRRGRSKERVATTQRRHSASHKPQHPRRGIKPQTLPRKKNGRDNSIDDIYRVERARGISPPEQDPPYPRQGYRHYDQHHPDYRRRNRSPSPHSSIGGRSNSSDSSRYYGHTQNGSPRRGPERIQRRQLLKAASKCTGDYLTRIKIQAPRRNSTLPWVDSISSAFHRMGFTIIDTKFEEREGIVTILAPPESVARKINQLHPRIQAAILSIRAARVCRNPQGYKLQVF